MEFCWWTSKFHLEKHERSSVKWLKASEKVLFQEVTDTRNARKRHFKRHVTFEAINRMVWGQHSKREGGGGSWKFHLPAPSDTQARTCAHPYPLRVRGGRCGWYLSSASKMSSGTKSKQCRPHLGGGVFAQDGRTNKHIPPRLMNLNVLL